MKRALIITENKFPGGDAGANRQEIFAKMLVAEGYKVDIIGLGKPTGKSFQELETDVFYKSLRSKNTDILHRVCDRLLFSSKIKSFLQENLYDLILIVTVPLRLIRFLQKYAKKHSTILVHDSVEWYSPCEFKLGFFSPLYLINDRMNRIWINSNFRVVAISNFLGDHFRNKGCRVTVIPFISDAQSYNILTSKSCEVITFIYAGQIGRKDHLKSFFTAISQLSHTQQKRIRVEIYGPTYEKLLKTGNIDEALYGMLKDIVSIHGRVSKDYLVNAYEKANFSILFRNPNERYAKAGFPTKVTESLSHGIGIFCNLSSDLSDYLEDGYNSIIAATESVDDIREGLVRILSLEGHKLCAIQRGAKKTADEKLDYHMYMARFHEFIQ